MDSLALFSKAIHARASLIEKLVDEGTNSFRLFCGEREGIPAFKAERFGEVAIFYVQRPQCALSDADLKNLASWLLQSMPVRSVYLKTSLKNRSRQAPESAIAAPIAGVGNPDRTQISEMGTYFWIDPSRSFAPGLFVDQRANRRAIVGLFQGARVLNLFSYTGAFSVLAAKHGALQVTSVDVSKTYLEWSRENFLANQIHTNPHRFFCQDALSFLAAANRRGERYDVVILDPPTFGRSSRGAFTLRRSAGNLFQKAFGSLEREGHLFFSCNFSEWNSAHLHGLAERYLPAGAFRFLPLPPPDEDVALASEPVANVLVQRIK